MQAPCTRCLVRGGGECGQGRTWQGEREQGEIAQFSRATAVHHNSHRLPRRCKKQWLGIRRWLTFAMIGITTGAQAPPPTVVHVDSSPAVLVHRHTFLFPVDDRLARARVRWRGTAGGGVRNQCCRRIPVGVEIRAGSVLGALKYLEAQRASMLNSVVLRIEVSRYPPRMLPGTHTSGFNMP